MSWVNMDQIDCGSPEGVERLKRMFEEEYRTLASIKDQLLQTAPGQWVAIQGPRYEVRPSLDDAERAAYSQFERRLFFLGRIDEREIDTFLSVLD